MDRKKSYFPHVTGYLCHLPCSDTKQFVQIRNMLSDFSLTQDCQSKASTDTKTCTWLSENLALLTADLLPYYKVLLKSSSPIPESRKKTFHWSREVRGVCVLGGRGEFWAYAVLSPLPDRGIPAFRISADKRHTLARATSEHTHCAQRKRLQSTDSPWHA